MPRLVVWGCGELGGRVATGWEGPALGLTRTDVRHDRLREQDARPELGSAVPWLQSDDMLLFSLPGHERQQAAGAAPAAHPPPRRAVFVSTTGYYGTPTGLVNEQTPAGKSARAQSIAAAEHTFRTWAGERGVILRLGGLYGPGRGPMAAPARQETVRLRPPEFAPALNQPPARFDVSLLRRDLLPTPAYPDWRAALATAIED